jgi:hypothetical protein
MSVPGQHCGNCSFSVLEGAVRSCCFQAPAPLASDSSRPVTPAWAVVLDADWCGDWSAVVTPMPAKPKPPEVPVVGQDNCGSCVFASSFRTVLKCCRNAPRPLVSDSPRSVKPAWPVVRASDWCSEYKSPFGLAAAKRKDNPAKGNQTT